MSPRNASDDKSLYQEMAVARLRRVLDEHGFPTVDFERTASGERPLVAAFFFNGQRHEIEIFENSVVMTSGKSLFEIFLREEFKSPEIEISSFAIRLARYLEGKEW